MLTIKNQAGITSFVLLAFVALLAGCTPPGPRALLDGKRLLERGDYAQAVKRLQTATSLLSTNAQAWNYLGLAFHQTGQVSEAEKAYQRALALDHDLSEAHYNLGCLWLSQNRLEAAKTELTAFTLRRSGSVEGFLKLATVQTRAREWGAAERSYGEVLRLSPKNPDALTGLGIARVQRGHPSEAALFFRNALKQQPTHRAALLNLAIVSQQNLRDFQTALEKYREYLALRPPPENAEAVRAVVRQLEQELAPLPRPATNLWAASPTNPVLPRAQAANTNRAAIASKTPAPNRVAPAPRPAQGTGPAPGPATEFVKVAEEPAIKPAPATATTSPAPPAVTGSASAKTESSRNGTAASNPPEVAAAGDTNSKSGKPTLLQRMNPLNLLGSSGKSPSVPRYAYQSPPRPGSGDRPAAERAFAQGVQAHQARRLADAVRYYQDALRKDPSFFDANYNLGLAAGEMGNTRLALSAYEAALAIRPESLDARYNFALTLKQANFLLDAAREWEKILTRYPNEPRSHLALGNLYAQQLQQPAKARLHYQKVLEVEPNHPQASAISYWLSDHPQ